MADKLKAGNWKSFDSFVWWEQPDDADAWALWNYVTRDSDLMTRANAQEIEAAMKPFTKGKNPDAKFERHNHWACGWVELVSVRMVGANGKPTKAGKTANELLAKMADYPLLSEDTYYNLIVKEVGEIDAYCLREIAGNLGIKTKADTKAGLMKAIRAHKDGDEALERWVTEP